MSLQYQNPSTVNAVLDSETVTIDSATGQPVVREFVIPQESINSFDASSKMVDLLEQVRKELKAIRVLLEADVPPQLIEFDEISEFTEGVEDATAEGIEEN